MELRRCYKLESVFSAPVAHGLMQLEHISIFNCKLMEAVVIPSEGGDIYKAKEVTTKEGEEITFPKLRVLELDALPCFSSFCKVNCLPPTTTNNNQDPVIQSFFNKVNFPVIESLRLWRLPWLTKICDAQPQKGSSNAMTSSSSTSKVLFATLKKLDLSELPELIGNPLWKYEYDRHQQKQGGSTPIRIDWLSNLTNLKLFLCDKLESVFSAPVARGLIQLKEISISNCKLIEAVVIPSEVGDIYKAKEATTEEEEEIMFPKLEELVFRRLPCFSSFCKVRTTIKMPQLKILKLFNLPKITSPRVSLTIPDSNHDPVIQSFFNKVTLPSLEELELSCMDNLMEIWPGELEVPLKLRKLRVHFCPRLLNGDLLPSNWMQCGMSVLENVEVKECQSVEVIFNLQGLRTVKELGDADLVVGFPMLEYLDLLYLPKLTHVWKINATSPSSFQGFQKLTHIKIKGCSSLRNLFPTCVAKLLQSLKELEILECAAMEAIFAVENPKVDDHDNEGTSSTYMVFLLPQLEVLNLSYLPNLRSLCPQGFTFHGTRLKRLTVVYCPNIEQHCWRDIDRMEIIPKSTDIRLLDGKVILPGSDEEPILVTIMDESIDKEVQGCLHEAKSIRFMSCGKLLSVISSNLIGRLHNLASLEVWGCNSMEAIFDLTEFECKEESASQLKELRVEYLPKLTQLWNNTPQQSHYHFQGLKYLEVKNCDCLRYIFTVSMAKVLVNLKDLIIARCEKVEKIVTRDEGGKGESEEKEETGQLFIARCSIKLINLPNLICLGPAEDNSKFLTNENLQVGVMFCPKYRGFRTRQLQYISDEYY